jgi:hypothetical protein
MPGTNDIYGGKASAPLTNPTAAAVFLTQDSVTSNAASPSTPTKANVVYLPEVESDSVNLGNNAGVKWPLGAVRYSVRIAGRVAAGASTTATFTLQLGNSTTPGSNTTVATGSALTTGVFNLLGNYQIVYSLVYDPTSKLLSGSVSGNGGSTNAIVTPATVTPTTVDLSLGKQALCFTALVATGNAATLVYLDEFALEIN